MSEDRDKTESKEPAPAHPALVRRVEVDAEIAAEFAAGQSTPTRQVTVGEVEHLVSDADQTPNPDIHRAGTDPAWGADTSRSTRKAVEGPGTAHVMRRRDGVAPRRPQPPDRSGDELAEGSTQALIIGRIEHSPLPRDAALRSTLPEPTLWNGRVGPDAELLSTPPRGLDDGWRNDPLGETLRATLADRPVPDASTPLPDFHAALAGLETAAAQKDRAALAARVGAFADLKLDRELAARGAWHANWVDRGKDIDILAHLDHWAQERGQGDPELALCTKLRSALLSRAPVTAEGLKELLGEDSGALGAEVRTWLGERDRGATTSPIALALARWQAASATQAQSEVTENAEEHPESAALRTAYALAEGFDPIAGDAQLATLLERAFRRLHLQSPDSPIALELAVAFARRAGEPAHEREALVRLIRLRPDDPRVGEWAQRYAFLQESTGNDETLAVLEEARGTDPAGRARAAWWRTLGHAERFRDLADKLGEDAQDGRDSGEAQVIGYRAAAWLGDEANAETLVSQWMATLATRQPDFCVAQSLVRGSSADAPTGQRRGRRDRRETGSATWLGIRTAEQAEWSGNPATAVAMYRSSLATDSLERARLYLTRAELASGQGPDWHWDEAQTRAGVNAGAVNLPPIASDCATDDERIDMYRELAEHHASDPASASAFWLRAGEAARRAGKYSLAREAYQKAMGGARDPAIVYATWRQAAIAAAMVDDIYQAALLEADCETLGARRAILWHLAGVIAMDHRGDKVDAALLFERVIRETAAHRDAYLRLRSIWEEEENHERLLWLLGLRLKVETLPSARVEVMTEMARIHRDVDKNLEEACAFYKHILKLDPGNRDVIRMLAETAWQLENWDDAAEMLVIAARITDEPQQRAEVYYKLGVLYADHLGDRRWAMQSFAKSAGADPSDTRSLVRMVELRIAGEEWDGALQASETLLTHTEAAPAELARWGRMQAVIYWDGLKDRVKAERAFVRALEADPSSLSTLEAIIDFYIAGDDRERARVYLDRLATVLALEIARDPSKEEMYSALARVQTMRADSGVSGARAVARFAGQSSLLLGGSDPETRIISESPAPELRLVELGVFENEQLLFPRSVIPELRGLLTRLGGRLGKYLGRDVSELGVGKDEAVRDRSHPVLTVLRGVANALCVSEPELYITKRKPDALMVEPTQPATLVLGSDVAALPEAQLRFLAGAALFSVRTACAIPLRLGQKEFGILLRALLTPFDVPAEVFAADSDAVNAEIARCKKLVPNHMLVELRPYALAICGAGHNAEAIWQGMSMACHRAGLLVAGEMAAAVAALGRAGGYESIQADGLHPEVRSLLTFATSDEMARLCAIMGD